MDETYNIALPDGINEFDYDGTTYQSNDTFQTSSACETIAFYNAAKSQNPKLGRTNKTPKFWQTMEQKCQANAPADPPDTGKNTPVENQPIQTDSAVQQGADTLPDDGVLKGETNNEEDFIPPTEEPERPESGVSHTDISDESSQETTQAGDPVDLFTGSFTMQETDLKIPNTVLPMEVSRIYRSGIAAFGPFGWNWDHNYNIYLRVLNDNNIAVWRNLHEDIFTFDGNEYEPPRGRFEKLTRLPGLNEEYEIAASGGRILKFSRPAGWLDVERIPLIQIRDRYDNQINFTYGVQDHLLKVEDNDGRFFIFEYDECGLIVGIRDHTDRTFRYDHNEETKQLICALSPPITDYPDGLTRIYHYEDPWTHQKLRHNIVRVEDSEGNIYLENTYEHDPGTWHFARVTSQLHGGYLYQFCYKELQYVPANPLFINISSVQVQVMNPDYGLETYTFNYRGDLLDQRYRLSRDRSFRIVAWQYEYDSQGNKISVTRPDGSQELWIYDDQHNDPRMRHNLLRKEITAASGFPSPSRIIWRGVYEPRFQLLISEKNELNQETRYKYDFELTPANPANAGHLKEIHYPDTTLPDGTIQQSKTRLEYNNRGQLTEVRLPDGTIHQMTYGQNGNEKGRLISQKFDVNGLNVEHKIQYDIFGNMEEWTDGNGNKIIYEFNALGLLEKFHQPLIDGKAAPYAIHYNMDRKAVAYESPAGAFSETGWMDDFILDSFERDVLGYPTRYQLAANTSQVRNISVCNDFRGLPLRISNPDGSVILKKYDERGLLLEEIIRGHDGNELKASNVYDRFGHRVKSTDFNGQIIENEYDGFSRLHRQILSNGSIIEYNWGPGDLLISVETTGDDGSGVIRQLQFQSYEYDEKGRQTAIHEKIFTDNPGNSSNKTTTLFYDVQDRIVKEINLLGGITHYQFDGMDRLINTTDPNGNEERFIYDDNSNLIRIDKIDINPDGSASLLSKSAEYDERNRLVAIIEPDGSRYEQRRDDRDLIIEETDPLGIITTRKYDGHLVLIQETLDAGGLNINFSWQRDAMSRPVEFMDPMGQVSSYLRDDLGRLTGTIYPNGLSSTKEYNERGLIATETMGSGTQFSFSYDTGNRLENIANPSTAPGVNSIPIHIFQYDGLDRLVSAKAGAHTVEREYDSLNRLIRERTNGNDILRRFDDLNGFFIQEWPDGRVEKYQYDDNGMIKAITEENHSGMGSQTNLIAAINPSGSEKTGKLEWGSGVRVLHRFDDRKRLSSSHISHANGLNVSFENRYDAADRKRIEAFNGPVSNTRLHDFDNKYRVTETVGGLTVPLPPAPSQAENDQAIQAAIAAAVAAAEKKSFAYNEGDERTIVKENGLPDQIYTFDSGHRISSDGTSGYTHHIDGTLESRGAVNYEMDALGRIVSITSGGEMVCKIEYDAIGRPSVIRQKTDPERVLNYLGKWVYQENIPGNVHRHTTIHPETGLPLAVHLPGKTINPVYDGRYNLRGILDDQGNWVELFDYSTFGIPTTYDSSGNPISGSSMGIDPVFGGQRYLPQPGLYLSGKRLMDPRTGLFLSPDIMGYVDSPSLYAYAGQNPVDYIDPDGDLAFLAGLLIAAAVGAAVSGGVNAVRQGIAISEGSQEGWEWGQFGLSVGVGAIAGPLLVVAPELAIPLAVYGVGQGAMGIANGRYATGTFDIVTSVVPFGFKGVRTATTGRGSIVGKYRGLGPAYSMSTRGNRLTLIGNAAGNYIPPIGGRKIGIGIARSQGSNEGHVAITTENSKGNFAFFERNASRTKDGSLVSNYRSLDTPPEVYDPLNLGSFKKAPVFEYTKIRISTNKVNKASNYARQRMSENHLTEPFDFKCSNCSHFAADVLSEAGFRGFGTGRGSGVNNNFLNFDLARRIGWIGPVLSSSIIQPNEMWDWDKK